MQQSLGKLPLLRHSFPSNSNRLQWMQVAETSHTGRLTEQEGSSTRPSQWLTGSVCQL